MCVCDGGYWLDPLVMVVVMVGLVGFNEEIGGEQWNSVVGQSGGS